MTKIAKLAAECVKDFEKNVQDSSERKKYVSRIKGLGSLIVQNGLAGAIVFIKAKEKGQAGKAILDHLNKIIEEKTGEKDFVEKITNPDNTEEIMQSKYLQIQMTALEGVKWLRRYADILLSEEETQ
ncbi:type III-B CRISPR module-associated protein Cmr5 [Fervidobacterium sp. 2310opik-2]|uniref:type III-B CRISPR module-associated protein Cmr5 n=1 Tax=Fervidobacterium sp. 2310opik-2 TaxID=1755815 RepID=UPI0013E0134D|nr:type III-B CRISPR module-associated protein Cmr5 [Fervidobacterium sp. 2310opik-2]KAF2961059.1 hypothetical protein AS161_03530 [Fervidobacterium sp. 2310opik-2]